MMQGGPQMHTIAAKAVNFKECATPEYAGVRPPGGRERPGSWPPPSGSTASGRRPAGTDTHLSLHDLQGVGVTGVDAEARADAAGIVLNKNAIPFDPQKANIASGIRVGTPCVTTQGMGTEEMTKIAELIATGGHRGRRRPRPRGLSRGPRRGDRPGDPLPGIPASLTSGREADPGVLSRARARVLRHLRRRRGDHVLRDPVRPRGRRGDQRLHPRPRARRPLDADAAAGGRRDLPRVRRGRRWWRGSCRTSRGSTAAARSPASSWAPRSSVSSAPSTTSASWTG